MNAYLLGLMKKVVETVTISTLGLFTSVSLPEEFVVENTNQTKNTITIMTSLKHETKTVENNNLLKDTKIVKQKGIDGKAYKDTQGNIIQIIENPTDEIIEIGTKEKVEPKIEKTNIQTNTDKYIGKMTGYGADCAGCSGNLSCKTKQGSWNLKSNGITYNDNTYGSVRIIAAALDKFPCGTVIEVKNPNLGTFNAIVLDTGGAMRRAWQSGTVLVDLAFASESNKEVYKATSSNVEYNVKRWGW